MGYGEVKKRLGELINSRFAEAREIRQTWASDPVRLEEVRRMGAERARKTARIVLDRARNACGLG
jgi:tryptophanyl-tRNA synthetase